jgi:hypothetical protein
MITIAALLLLAAQGPYPGPSVILGDETSPRPPSIEADTVVLRGLLRGRLAGPRPEPRFAPRPSPRFDFRFRSPRFDARFRFGRPRFFFYYRPYFDGPYFFDYGPPYYPRPFPRWPY